MKFKSKLGTAALEELSQEVAGEGEENQNPDGTAATGEAGAAEGGAGEGAEGGAAAGAAEGGAEGGAAEGGAAEGGEAGATGGAEGGEAGAGEGAAEGGAEGGEGGEGGEAPPAEGGADAGDAGTQEADAAVAAVDAVGEEEPVIGESAEAGDTAELISEEMAAADEAGDKAEATVDDVESLQEATEALTTTLDILQASMQTGGLTAPGAMLLRQNLRMACESINQPGDAILLPAMEDAETPTSRLGMAGDAIDAIKKFVARVMKTIAEAYQTFSSFIAKLWASLTDANKRLKARAEKLKAMAKGAEFNETITSKRLITAARINGQVVNLVEAAKATNESARFLCDASSYNEYLAALRAIENGTKAEKNEAEIAAEANKHLEALAKSVESKTQALFHIGSSGFGRGAAAAKSGGERRKLSLFGNRDVYLWVPKSVEELGGMIGGESASEVYPSEQTSQIKSLNEKECATICDEVIKTCDFLIANVSGSKSIAEFNAEIKKHSDAIMTRVENAIDASRKSNTQMPEVVKKASTWAQKAMYSLPQLPCSKIARAIPGSNSILLDAVAASLKKATAAAPAEGAAAAA